MDRPRPAEPSSSTGASRNGTSGGDGPKDRIWLHVVLFAAALASTVYAGMTWSDRWLYYQEVGRWAWYLDGLRYGVCLVGFLTAHEFGHYLTARYHGINTSLPYFIPFPFNGVGNFGAVIRIREPLPTTRKLFDVGVAGPLAGFVVAVAVIGYAVATLPPPEYLMDVPGHEALKAHIRTTGTFPEEPPDVPENGLLIIIGQTPLFWLLGQVVPDLPPMYEIYHYPMLFAGWFALFFTALNLLPVGQLDGGHVLYALFGRRWHGRLARGFVMMLLVSGGMGFLQSFPEFLAEQGVPPATTLPLAAFLLSLILYVYLYRIFRGVQRRMVPALVGVMGAVGGAMLVGEAATRYGYTGWLVWTALIVFLIRVDHPPVEQPQPLTRGRRALAYLAIVIFFLCFSIRPLMVVG